MAENTKMLELWIEAVCAELQELLGVPVAARSTEDVPQAAGAYRSMLLVEGSVHGVMYVTISSANMVQIAQMAAGDPVDSHAAWTEGALEAWRRLLDVTGTRLATRLTEEFSEPAQGRCTILLAETSAVDGMHVVSGSEPAASGATVQQWLLQAGQSEITLSSSVQVEFSGEQLQVSAAQTAQLESSAQIPDSLEPSADEKTDEGISDAKLAQSSPAVPEENEVAKILVEEDSDIYERKSSAVDPATHAAEASKRDSRAAQLQDRQNAHEPRQRLDLLLDIELEATLRFGALELPLREVLELGPGDVLSLDRHVQEPVDLVVGDRIVARGEVVLVGGNFGLHVTEVAEPRSRLETIRCLF
jgi:flagellar motor switch protein FliN/FliY